MFNPISYGFGLASDARFTGKTFTSGSPIQKV
jgi:hypothetical protein